ncbi:MAG TPA: hypothetical protein VIS10_13175 [Anaerolineales bacterium]
MVEALRFFRAYEIWIYLILGLGGLIYIRKFILAWQELREAAFGLERESALGRLNQSASILVVVLALTITEFFLVSFVAPSLPEAIPLLTPTLDLLATTTSTLPPTTLEAGTSPIQATATVASTPAGLAEGCIPGQVMITSPPSGTEISGVVVISGTASITNFGFFKLEMKRVEESNWLTILAGNEVKVDDTLGAWNTSLLTPGDHELSLVVTDNQGNSLSPCIIGVRVINTAAPQP